MADGPAYELGHNVTVTADFHNESNALDSPDAVTLTITEPDGTVVTVPGNLLDNPSEGVFSYEILLPVLGTWTYRFAGTGDVVAAQTGTFHVVQQVPAPPRPFCSTWVSVPSSVDLAVDPLLACLGNDLSDPAVRANAVLMADVATEVLFLASHRRFPGPCTVRRHVCPSRTMVPCRPGETTLVLPASTDYVLAVELDGAPMAPTAYRLAGNVLTRCDGAVWPACPSPCADQSTGLVVHYTWGTPPPSGRLAAARLTCELLRSHTRQASALPPGLTSVTRQGVTLTRELLQFLQRGHSGIWEVEQFLGGGYGRAEPVLVFPEQVRPLEWGTEAVVRP